MEKRKESRCRCLLDQVLERRVALYALAAGAALAGSPTLNARVTFTPSNAVVQGKQAQYDFLPIDLNNDGVNDFVIGAIVETCRSESEVCDSVNVNGYGTMNAVVAKREDPADLRNGREVDQSESFVRGGIMAQFVSGRGRRGPFVGAKNRYLGVKFLINGEVHYGWIGFRSVSVDSAELFGWAYETIPDKAIYTGFSIGFGDAQNASLQGGNLTSLELLANGHTAIAERRRRVAAS